MSRREALLLGATTVVLSCVAPLNAGARLKTKEYAKKYIISLHDLKANEPFYFSYPESGGSKNSFIVKLQEKAAGGVGEDGDIVAFNQYCTHMGAPLEGKYNKVYKVMGACPMHLSTFDLTRHGMIVSGHATEPLPQVVLKVEGDDIYAVGISGLMYGYRENPV